MARQTPRSPVGAKLPDGWQVRPATPERWNDLAELFGENGACGGCWCQYFRRARPEYRAGHGEGNRSELRRQLSSRSGPPGLIAYQGTQPVGWVSVGPRAEYHRLADSRALAPIDARPVWSVVCFFVRAGHRRAGVAQRLLSAAVEFARASGASMVEGYPLDESRRAILASEAYVGVSRMFRAAGFREVARRTEARPIVRLELRPPGPTGSSRAPRSVARSRAATRGPAPQPGA